MLKLTLTTNRPGSDVVDKANEIANLLGVCVEVVGLDGYSAVVAVPSLTVANAAVTQAPPVEVPTPVFTPVFTPPESAEQTNG